MVNYRLNVLNTSRKLSVGFERMWSLDLKIQREVKKHFWFFNMSVT